MMELFRAMGMRKRSRAVGGIVPRYEQMVGGNYSRLICLSYQYLAGRTGTWNAAHITRRRLRMGLGLFANISIATFSWCQICLMVHMPP